VLKYQRNPTEKKVASSGGIPQNDGGTKSLRLTQSGREEGAERRLLSGVKRTWLGDYLMSLDDPNVWSGRALQETLTSWR
jgi:hypothetical protein